MDKYNTRLLVNVDCLEITIGYPRFYSTHDATGRKIENLRSASRPITVVLQCITITLPNSNLYCHAHASVFLPFLRLRALQVFVVYSRSEKRVN